MSARVAPRPWTTWTARTAVEFGKVLAGYRDHLTQERGLAKPTVAGYLSVARKFFEHLTSSGRHDLSRLDATAVSQFVVRAGQTSCIGTTKQVITGLRSLLRFLHVAGQSPDARRFGACGSGLARERSAQGAAARACRTPAGKL